MTLRYKGIPQVGFNVIADKIPLLCFCEFVAVGFPLNAKDCSVHDLDMYGCDECCCTNYRPNKPKLYPSHWPLCSCGHCAQEHNNQH